MALMLTQKVSGWRRGLMDQMDNLPAAFEGSALRVQLARLSNC
jgi:hypothetical protein